MFIESMRGRLSILTRPLLALAVALLVLTVGAGRAEAKSVGDILNEYRAALNGLSEAYMQYQAGDVTGASLTLQRAQATLEGVKYDLADPALVEAGLGGKIKSMLRKTGVFQERIVGAQEYVDGGRATAKVLLGKVTSTWKYGQRVADYLGKPMLQFTAIGKAGFYNAGERATLQFALPEEGCPEPRQPAVVTVENVFSRRGLDTENVVVDQARGLIHVPMGVQSGGGRVTVTACGRSEEILLYNKGTGYPDGFPHDPPSGNYRVTCSTNGVPVGPSRTTRITDVRRFWAEVQQAIKRAVASVQGAGNCTTSVAWYSATDTRFGYTITIRCTYQGAVGTVTQGCEFERL